jgi:hypothetical protein
MRCGKSFVRQVCFQPMEIFERGQRTFLLTRSNMCVLTYRKWMLTYKPASTH